MSQSGPYEASTVDAIVNGLKERFDYIEAQLVRMADRIGIPYETWASSQNAVPQEVVELARAGKTLEAMKRYRELTGATADQAKQAVLGA